MKKRSKRYKLIEKKKIKEKIAFDKSLDLVKETCTSKIDESIDVSIRINTKQSKGGDFNLRTVVKLPNGNGKKFNLILTLFLISFTVTAEEVKLENNTEFNVFTGMFDFSDDGKRSTLIGLQHQNENLNKDTFLGNLSPITGAMITADSATYFYTGIQANYKLGAMNFTPSFTPGYYNQGDGKDLGHALEFKSEVQLSLELPKDSQLGFSYNHLSNASLGSKNPGANSYMFNFLKKF